MICLLHIIITASEDYTEVTDFSLMFGASVSSIDVPVFILDDSILEGDTDFFGSLESSISSVELEPDMTVITIFDDAQDRKYLWS